MIVEFQNEFRWLSNFWHFESPLIYQGLHYLTNEHFYVAMKTKDLNTRYAVSNHPIKGLKRFGNTFPLRDDWDDIKINVMLFGLRFKFSKANPTLRYNLLQTADMYIQEGNRWGDMFWGVCMKTGEGENNLGRLLMQVREEIRNES
jgi:hypothetical protein